MTGIWAGEDDLREVCESTSVCLWDASVFDSSEIENAQASRYDSSCNNHRDSVNLHFTQRQKVDMPCLDLFVFLLHVPYQERLILTYLLGHHIFSHLPSPHSQAHGRSCIASYHSLDRLLSSCAFNIVAWGMLCYFRPPQRHTKKWSGSVWKLVFV